jgi:luciferase family oxidoreductase group 1
MIPFSVLDLSPIAQGSDAGQALKNSRDLARHCESLGYTRFWLAEHHGMPGIASAATSVAIGYVAEGTSTIRVGAGGIMLPNHSPLVIAEQFGTLASLYPGRIDLGVGRAPGTDPVTARALRRHLESAADAFPQDVAELLALFDTPQAGQRILAVPGAGTHVPVWILGSSTFGAQLAAAFGLPYAFASHFAPAQLMDAIAVYRANFRASRYGERPYVMLGYNVFAAETDDEAQLLASSVQQAFVNLRLGRPSELPPPVENYKERLSPMAQAVLRDALSCSAIGSPETVRRQVAAFIARTAPDELMVTSMMYDHAARKRSYEITAQVREGLS